jgi:hypothetical protein
VKKETYLPLLDLCIPYTLVVVGHIASLGTSHTSIILYIPVSISVLYLCVDGYEVPGKLDRSRERQRMR